MAPPHRCLNARCFLPREPPGSAKHPERQSPLAGGQLMILGRVRVSSGGTRELNSSCSRVVSTPVSLTVYDHFSSQGSCAYWKNNAHTCKTWGLHTLCRYRLGRTRDITSLEVVENFKGLKVWPSFLDIFRPSEAVIVGDVFHLEYPGSRPYRVTSCRILRSNLQGLSVQSKAQSQTWASDPGLHYLRVPGRAASLECCGARVESAMHWQGLLCSKSQGSLNVRVQRCWIGA